MTPTLKTALMVAYVATFALACSNKPSTPPTPAVAGSPPAAVMPTAAVAGAGLTPFELPQSTITLAGADPTPVATPTKKL